MSVPFIRMAIVAGIVSVLAGSTVEAAKGVKKATLEKDQHIVSGVIMAVSADGNGGGFLQIKTTTRHKQPHAANSTTTQNSNLQNHNKAAKSHHSVIVHINEATKFANQNGNSLNGTSTAVGANVRILAKGDQALNVTVLSQGLTAKGFVRSRARKYVPHMSVHVPIPME